MFTSANGVRYFFGRLYQNDLDARALGAMKVATVGNATAQQLTGFGIQADIVPDTESSAGLLEAFNKLPLAKRREYFDKMNLKEINLT